MKDPQLLYAVARGLNTLGTAEGVERLLRFMEAQEANRTITPRLVKQMTASLRQVRNTAAIAPLKARLLQDRAVERETTRIVGEALAAVGNVRATEADSRPQRQTEFETAFALETQDLITRLPFSIPSPNEPSSAARRLCAASAATGVRPRAATGLSLLPRPAPAVEYHLTSTCQRLLGA
jgi:hypothetical protein